MTFCLNLFYGWLIFMKPRERGEAMGMPTQFDVRRAKAVKELANTLVEISKEESESTLKKQD